MKSDKKDQLLENGKHLLQQYQRKSPILLCLAATGLVFLLIMGCVSLFGRGSSKPAGKSPEPALAERTLPQDPPETTPPSESTPEQTPPAVTEPEEPENGKYIYLTFDDGPGKNTERVLDILDQYHVRATFFTVGYFVDRYPEKTAAIISRGQLIACHSYSHEFSQCYASADAFMNELEKWKQAVLNSGESLPDRICIRFPGGSRTPNAKNCSDEIKKRLLAGGYRWFDWNAANCDKYPQGNTKNLPDSEYFWNSYVETVSPYDNRENPHVVFLMHDSVNATVDMLPRMIEDLLARGYTFRTLDQHPDWDS